MKKETQRSVSQGAPAVIQSNGNDVVVVALLRLCCVGFAYTTEERTKQTQKQNSPELRFPSAAAPPSVLTQQTAQALAHILYSEERNLSRIKTCTDTGRVGSKFLYLTSTTMLNNLRVIPSATVCVAE